MRFDEELARSLSRGVGAPGPPRPTLRLFRWNPWAVSIGYNQNVDELDAARCARAGVDIVRRPTGGRAILHAEELTYSVVMFAERKSVLEVYNAISQALVCGLRLYGVEATLQKAQVDFPATYRRASSIPCFTSSARYEIEWQGRKLVGSAQRRFNEGERDVVLQHGSILCGPAHRRLSEFLSVKDDATLERIRAELIGKTVDLAEILSHEVDMTALEVCIREGFEREWNVTFEEGVIL
jgi:lipoate-protein ligase A